MENREGNAVRRNHPAALILAVSSFLIGPMSVVQGNNTLEANGPNQDILRQKIM